MSVKTENPIYLINKRYNSFRDSGKRIAEYIQNHMDEVVLLSLNGLAKKCNTSDATVLRFCRSLGYQGFPDFKISLVPELLRNGKKVYIELDEEKGPGKVKNILRGNFILQIDSTLENYNEEMLKSIALQIIQANRILIIGLGGSAGVANIFYDSLGSLGVYSSFLGDRSIIQNVVPMLGPDDVIVGISHSGETEEVVSALKTAKEHDVTTIGITNFSPSNLSNIVQYPLITSVPDNLLGSYSCQARISQLMILEIILFEISKSLKKNDSNVNQ